MFRLALALGCTVDELHGRMTSEELTEWQAYWSIEPWGQWRDNWHAAQLLAMTANINRGKRAPFNISDFMYRDLQAQKEDTTKQFIKGLDALSRPKTDG